MFLQTWHTRNCQWEVEISDVIPATLKTISRLEYLDLEDNRIEHLESEVLCWLVNLKYLALQGKVRMGEERGGGTWGKETTGETQA
jgi:hypothetical protein